MSAAFCLVCRCLYQLVCDHSFDAIMKSSDGVKVFNFKVNDRRIFFSPLPDGLIAQLVKHCTGIAEVGVIVSCGPKIFSPFFLLLLKQHSKTAKIINIKVVSIRSLNEISLI